MRCSSLLLVHWKRVSKWWEDQKVRTKITQEICGWALTSTKLIQNTNPSGCVPSVTLKLREEWCYVLGSYFGCEGLAPIKIKIQQRTQWTQTTGRGQMKWCPWKNSTLHTFLLWLGCSLILVLSLPLLFIYCKSVWAFWQGWLLDPHITNNKVSSVPRGHGTSINSNRQFRASQKCFLPEAWKGAGISRLQEWQWFLKIRTKSHRRLEQRAKWQRRQPTQLFFVLFTWARVFTCLLVLHLFRGASMTLRVVHLLSH